MAISAEKFVGVVELPNLLGVYDRDAPGGARYPTTVSPVSIQLRPDRKSEVLLIADQPDDLETKEFDYELSGVITYEVRDQWYYVGFYDKGVLKKGWIGQPHVSRFIPLSVMLLNRMNFLTEAWSGSLWQKPEDHKPELADLKKRDATVVETKVIKDQLWAKVKIKKSGHCSGSDEMEKEGWTPVFSERNELLVWFRSRGC